MEKHCLTPDGYSNLRSQLNDLVKIKRPECIEAIAEAQTGGGELSENAEYLQAMEERDKIESKISDLSSILENSQVIDVKNIKPNGKVSFGTTVTLYDVDLEDEFKYKIVGEREANIKEGSISYLSPLGRAVMGSVIGDEFDIETPSGSRTFEVLEVEYI